ncbi:preprotein translocase subunit SecE [Mucilaginibacter lacusdianchii]|uniref:preprotein translocase subunit SecE n=1 Tax=Mucilaginibacter lacusdianchii TaxID=2684211 RepID=UPI00131D5E2A|nr:preprotein translocase subunit SecE [Mucilaginibacter sp. JXJ CY 39]
MKLRLTPLNFATAFLVVLAIVTWVYKPVAITGKELVHWTGTVAIIFLFLAFSVWFLDLIFRNFFRETKMLWTIELSFIVLTAIIYLLVK